MSNPVNRTPLGLVTLLDLAGRAQAPRVLNDEVRLMVTGDAYYESGSARPVLNNSSPAIAGGFWSCNIGVPASERWRVRAFSAYNLGLAAGTSYTLAPAIQLPGANAWVLLSPAQAFVATNVVNLYANLPDIIFPPGTLFGIWVVSVTLGTAAAFTGVVWYTPLQG